MNQIKTFFLLLGDIVALYASLLATLALRYGPGFYEQFMDIQVVPFTIIFILWVVLFYIAGLYDLRRLQNNIDFLRTLALAIALNATLAILLFYFIPAFGIAPKTNLFIFLIIFVVIEVIWRRLANTFLSSGEAPNRIVLVGDDLVTGEIVKTIRENPQFGYTIVQQIREQSDPTALERAVAESHANIIAVPRHLKKESAFALALYTLFGKGILVIDIADLYERVLRKVPLTDIEETWFLENIEGAGKYYDSLKRAAELVFALVVGIILLPFEILIALIVKLSSPGPTIYRQVRMGQNGKSFTLYKFRTMRNDAEKHGAQWSSGTNDARVTAFGKFLRASHLDELPQLWNIIRGDISFVGPRPERPEFVAELKKKIPYYEIRLILKPGLTGWAQINHHADRDLDDVSEKLQYDIYYLENRSLIFDALIILRTLKTAVTKTGE